MIKKRGVLIVNDKDAQMIKAKHWMISRGITYKTFYLPVDIDVRKPVIMAEMTWIDRLLYRLTFSTKHESISAYM